MGARALSLGMSNTESFRPLNNTQMGLFTESDADADKDLSLFDASMPSGIEGQLEQLSLKKQQKFSSLSNRFLGAAETTFEQQFKDFWLTRYTHYSTPEKFHSRVAKAFSITPEIVEQMEQEFQLPGVRIGGRTRKSNDSFTASIYLDEEMDYTDPVDRFMRKVFNTRRSREIWTDYCTMFGRLSVDQIDSKDLKHVLDTTAFDIYETAKIFHVRACDLQEYVGKRCLPGSYASHAAPVRVMIAKRERLRQIAMHYAHLLYTSQAIPIPKIAQTLGMDPTALYNLGEQVVGDWKLPSPTTLHYVIDQTALMHFS